MTKQNWNLLVFFGLFLSFSLPALAVDQYAAVSDDGYISQSEAESSEIEPSTNYLAPAIKFSDLRNELGILLGAQAAIYTSPGFEIGIAGFALVNNVAGSSTNTSLQFGYGGATFGFRIFPYHRVSLVLGSLLGVGGNSLAVSDFNGAFVLIEPEAKILLNISPLFQLALGGGYRFVPRTNNTGGVKLSTTSGVVGTVGLQFSGI